MYESYMYRLLHVHNHNLTIEQIEAVHSRCSRAVKQACSLSTSEPCFCEQEL
uniref:Uncharacterized protein n=1 Tax=Physcomitrium patens TaxID=3218 RepID=A0A2K1J3H6_PHYPA|nr:hypothetical protein PHYPA_021921 [Physcomitrium patens]